MRDVNFRLQRVRPRGNEPNGDIVERVVANDAS